MHLVENEVGNEMKAQNNKALRGIYSLERKNHIHGHYLPSKQCLKWV